MPTQVPLIDDPELDDWLISVGIADRTRGALNLFASLLEQLERHLGSVSDPDMALNNLERFFDAARSPLATAALFDRDPTGIPILLKLFSTSQYLADLLIRDTEAYDFLRMTEGLPHAPEVLLDDLSSELRSAQDLSQAMVVIRRFKPGNLANCFWRFDRRAEIARCRRANFICRRCDLSGCLAILRSSAREEVRCAAK
jgi:glutamine synthetase adenylyltransferase